MSDEGKLKLSRRSFAITSLAAGFALAVRPVAAGTILTDTVGITANPVSIPVPDGVIPGYMAYPSEGSGFPILLVAHEIFGVHQHIQDVCRRFAKLGYFAIAPSLFAREGDPSTVKDPQTIIAEIVSKVPDQQIQNDLDATALYAAKSGGDAKRLGITGFCWGGRVAWLYATHNENLKAAVAWYGMVGTNPFDAPRIIDMVPMLKAPVLGLYGGKDDSISAESLDKMKAEIEKYKKHSEIIIYPDAGHGFFADYRPSYNAEAAKAGWQQCLTWLRENGC
jgi:carboxymethylenebutenolidase